MLHGPRTTKPLLAAFSVVFLSALAMTAPAQAQYAWDDDDDDWRPRRERTVVIERSIVRRPPAEEVFEESVVRRPVERTVIVKQPIVRPVVHKTVIVEKPVVHKVIRRVVVKRPVYVERVARRPVFVSRTALLDRRWHERRRCFLPERHLCR